MGSRQLLQPFVFQLSKLSIQNCFADLFDEVDDEIDVVVATEALGEKFICSEEVMEVRAGEMLAGVAFAAWINWIFVKGKLTVDEILGEVVFFSPAVLWADI